LSAHRAFRASGVLPRIVLLSGIEAGTGRKIVVLGSGVTAETFARLADGGPVRVTDAAQLDGQLVDRLREEWPDEIYLDLGAPLDDDVIARAGATALMDGVDVHFVLPGDGRPPVRAHAIRRGAHTLISVRAVRDGAVSRAVRRLVDVAGALVLLALAAPVMAVVALVVWLRMGRPIVYVQDRLGLSGRPFPLYKFRSMAGGADEVLRRSPDLYRIYVSSNFKLPEEIDPRITPLGRFLRRTSLDELPQLWNVLRGEMSLVGPRPIVPEELGKYGEYARMLVRVKPGLTGFWQVNGRSTVGYPERARMDLRYVAERSLHEDIQILLRTLPAVLRRRGAV
jgi:exopolysaccharide production protein ExoY